MPKLLSASLLIGIPVGTSQTATAQIIQAEPSNSNTDRSTGQNIKQVNTGEGEPHRLSHPTYVKAGVAAVGFGLIGLELWWFLFGKTKNKNTQQHPKD
ncbi:MAG: hypothetical protein AB8B99_08200 [Phormidesmis sp.]